jgi:hypothetical protein
MTGRAGAALEAVAQRLEATFEEMSVHRVAGCVVGAALGDEQLILAHGVRNLNTGSRSPRTPDSCSAP